MITSENINKWKAEQFITYLFLTVADSDDETTEDELAMAHRRTRRIINEYFQDSLASHDAIFQEVSKEFKLNDVNERKQVIESLSKRIHLDDEIKTDLIGDLNDIISSDDNVKESEHKALHFIRLVMAQN